MIPALSSSLEALRLSNKYKNKHSTLVSDFYIKRWVAKIKAAHHFFFIKISLKSTPTSTYLYCHKEIYERFRSKLDNCNKMIENVIDGKETFVKIVKICKIYLDFSWKSSIILMEGVQIKKVVALLQGNILSCSFNLLYKTLSKFVLFCFLIT